MANTGDSRGRRGRPSASSRETLEEAAFELFFEQGYEQTTASDIARRAGVARSSFFNYFASKADVLWVRLDAVLERVGPALDAAAEAVAGASGSASGGGFVRLADVLQEVAGWLQPDDIPWGVSMRELTGAGPDLAATGMRRFNAQRAAIERYLARTEPALPPLERASCAGALVGAVLVAGSDWVDAGTARGALAPLVDRATAPIFRAFGAL